MMLSTMVLAGGVLSLMDAGPTPRTGRAAAAAAAESVSYRGTSDASAAVALDDGHFLIADDENNLLRAYPFAGGIPDWTYDLNGFLQLEPGHPEADIEGAARCGRLIYWISSHGRNKDGKMRPNRYRFFATEIPGEDQNVHLRTVGRAYHRLLVDLLGERRLGWLNLEATAKLSDADDKDLAPKQAGLNIEALAADPDGQTLYIGFRNPRPRLPGRSQPQALAIPLLNPQALIEQAGPARFGEPLCWDLQGRGIRGMTYDATRRVFHILAGRHDEKSDFALFRWSGDRREAPVLVRRLFENQPDFTPETILVRPGDNRIWVFSDDGSMLIEVSGAAECQEDKLEQGKCPNKYLVDPLKKSFRGTWLKTESGQ